MLCFQGLQTLIQLTIHLNYDYSMYMNVTIDKLYAITNELNNKSLINMKSTSVQ